MILALNIGNSNITFGGYTPDGKLVFFVAAVCGHGAEQ